MELYIHRDGQQYGPYPAEEARAHLASGALRPDDLAWHEGASAWVPLAELAGIAPSPLPTAPATPSPSSSRTPEPRLPPMAKPARVPQAVPAQGMPAAASAAAEGGARRRRRSSPVDALRRRQRSAGFRNMGLGAVLFLLGAGATIATYELAASGGGGIYFVKWGLMLAGIVQFTKGAVQTWKA